jgi:polar amino acid transport system substrate-binding protein
MNSPVCAAVAKGETRLLEKVNAALALAKTDGSLNTLAMRWLNQPIPPAL